VKLPIVINAEKLLASKNYCRLMNYGAPVIFVRNVIKNTNAQCGAFGSIFKKPTGAFFLAVTHFMFNPFVLLTS